MSRYSDDPHFSCVAEMNRLELANANLKAELADARRSEAVLRGAVELLEGALRANADVERPEIAACLETSRRARAGELLK